MWQIRLDSNALSPKWIGLVRKNEPDQAALTKMLLRSARRILAAKILRAQAAKKNGRARGSAIVASDKLCRVPGRNQYFAMTAPNL
jgi:hypothetical protein